MPALIAVLRVSLRRTRADWPMAAAVWLVTAIAAALVAAAPIYWSAASLAGLNRTFADSPAVDRSIEVFVYAAPAHVADVTDQVVADLASLPGTGGRVFRDVRSTATLPLAPGPSVLPGDVAQLGFLDALEQHATLTGGAWPSDGVSTDGAIEVVLADGAARTLHLSIGDEVALANQVGVTTTVRVRLVGTFRATDPTDEFWHGDTQLTTGLVPGQGFRTFGPFLTTPQSLLLRARIPSVKATWRALPEVARLTVEDLAPLSSALAVLPSRLVVDLDQQPNIVTGLPELLAGAQRSLLASRTNVTLLMIQLATLSAYAVVLVALLLVDHRRGATSLLQSRGSGTSRVAILALAEAVILVLPAVLLGPWLAVAAVTVLDLVGPLASIGLAIAPRVTGESYLAAAAIGLVCVALLVLPAVLSARTFAAEQRAVSRQETQAFSRRFGLDVAVLAVAAVGLWQLRLYGAPISRTVRGDLGIDPLLVAAPGLSMLAGGLVALRILPLAARAVEGALTRRRDLVATLGSHELARRPMRYTRSILLLMIAISIGVFAVTYGATWSRSQLDQAAYQAGADVRVVPITGSATLPAWALGNAYAHLPGVRQALPVERVDGGVATASDSADLLAIDAARAADIVRMRADLSAVPLADLLSTLRAGRPDPGLATMPAGTAYLRITPGLEIRKIGLFDLGASGAAPPKPLDPSQLALVRVSVNAVIRDSRGLLVRADSASVAMSKTSPSIVLPLAPVPASGVGTAAADTPALDGPIELAGLGVDLWLPEDSILQDGSLGVASIATGASPDGPWTELASTPSAGGWHARTAEGTRVLQDVPDTAVDGLSVHIADAAARDVVVGNGTRVQAARLAFVPAAVAPGPGPIPAIVNQAFLARAAALPGDTVNVTVDGADVAVKVTGVVDAFPTTEPDKPLVVIDEPTLGLLRLAATSGTRSPSEWWIATTPGASPEVATALRASPFDSTLVVTDTGLALSLSTDPVAIGTLGALALGFVATAVLAVLGLVVSAAVSARERRTEFALLRALGLSGRQLAGWLWLESGSLVAVSLVAGTGLGLLVSWLVLPFVSMTQAAVAPVPPAVIEVPWDRILELDAASALALAGTLVVTGRLLRRLGLGSILRMGED